MHFLKAISSRRNAPSLDPIVRRFFGALADPVRSDLYPAPHEAAPSMKLTKNVYRMAEVFPANTSLVLSARARGLLEAVYTGAYLPCELAQCFKYPYRPGDTSFEDEPCFQSAPPDDADAIVRSFAQQFRCPCPAAALFELVAHRVRDVTGSNEKRWKDSVPIRLSDPDNGLQSLESNVSPSMVEEFGIIWDWGYWCRDDVFGVLDPLLRRPYFWTTRVDLEG